MSFKVTNSSKNIQYYTIILDKGQIQEEASDSGMLRIRSRPKPTSRYKKNFEKIVYDRHQQKWVTKIEWNA